MTERSQTRDLAVVISTVLRAISASTTSIGSLKDQWANRHESPSLKTLTNTMGKIIESNGEH